ncbi:hypothetical protein NSQ54_09975 [Alkalihalobacillus sp. FSL W8-0930]
MKKVEIKKFGIGSVLKSTIYLYFIPIVLIVIVFAFAIIIGALQEGAAAFISIPIMLFMLLLYTALYAGVIALMTLIYNWLAGKFGGLVVTIEEREEC